MNKMLIRTLILVLVAVASPSWAAVMYPPHDTSNNLNCRTCHASNPTLTNKGVNAFNNVCTSCHRPGAAVITGQVTPFTQSDFANPFGTYTANTRPARPYQTSHKWFGSDAVGKAGATSPTGTWPTELLNRTNTYLDLRGTLSCTRCHDIHNAANSPFVNRANHLLRADNTNDAMCLKCHTGNNSTTHLSGTHPINVDYAAAVAKDPSKLSANPVSSNPSNYTATLNLVNGKVFCSTCHKAHYADGNSRTFDNRSSAVFGQLSTSNGYLLRTDLKGPASLASSNICTNCHTGKRTHHGRSQNVQCTDCHGGHVFPGDGSAANVFLVKAYINFSSAKGAVRNKQVFFQMTGAARNYKDTNSKGICQACHAVPPAGGVYPSQHDSSSAKVCESCHSHKSSAGSFSGGCATCHGFPPQDSTTGGPTGKAAGYAGNEAGTKHKKHYDLGYGCKECHYPTDTAFDNANHNKGSFQDVFVDKTGIIAATAGANPNYNSAGQTCANTYCHSNGNPAGGPFVTQVTPAWNSGTTTTCSSCHDASPATNAHQKHIATGFGCDTCHNATIKSGNTIYDSTKHANGSKDLSFYNPLLGISGTACSNLYCHSNGKKDGTFATIPAWTATYTNNCSLCHASTAISTGAHQKHLGAATVYGPNLNKDLPPVSCNNCHSYPTGHVNGSIQSPSTCSVLCHPNGLGTATWTNGLRIVDCTTCHAPIASRINKYASYKADFPSTPHNGACTQCHSSTSAHIGVAGGTSRVTSETTVCTSCHDTVTVGPDFRNLPKHFTIKGSPNMSCQMCHDPHGTRNTSMIKSRMSIFGNTTTFEIVYTGKTVPPVDYVTNRGLCQVCHTKTNHYQAGKPESIHYVGGNCFGCHDHRNANGAFYPSGSCNTCHGYPPVPRNVAGLNFGTQNNWSSAGFERYSGGGGAHTIAGHVPKTAKASEGWTNCAICHNKGDAATTPYHVMTTPVETHVPNLTVAVDPRYRFNPDKLVSYSSAKLVNPPLNKTGKCFNASCHFKPTPPWSAVK